MVIPIKLERAHKLGETLITVPCWWDGTPGRYVKSLLVYLSCSLTCFSLVATIRMQRSDLLADHPITTPIDNEPPHGFFASIHFYY